MLRVLRNMALTRWIIFAMVLGIALGAAFPDFSQHLRLVSNVFLRMIKSIIVPLIFSTLVTGIAGHSGNLKSVGRLALRSLVYFEVVTTLALFIGLAAVNLVQPGRGVSLETSAAAQQDRPEKALTLESRIEHIVPTSIVEAAANNEVLQVVFFAILFAVALAQVKDQAKQTILGLCEALAEVTFKLTGVVMKFAPFGIGAAIAVTVGHSGPGVMVHLGKVILTFYGALAVFLLAVLLPVMRIARIPVRKFCLALRQPALIAFSTTSSEAAMPDAMRQMRAFGVPNRIVSFVLPAGYSFNLDGTTLYLAVASIFVAQAADIQLDLGQQLLIMLTLMLTAKGAAGVPRAALVILSGTVATFRLPMEGVAVLLAIDAIMDMARTTVNLIGNCLASAVVARWEGELDLAHDEGSVMEPIARDHLTPSTDP